MNHEQAFLQAIRETPDDDAPRLIYADWLEEQGGASCAARADFIRLQCRLDAMPEDDPARDRLEDEAADLLAEYETEWTQPLHGIAAGWLFRRGFIERITIGAQKFLTHSECLFDFAPLRSLHFLIHPRDVPHLAACPHLRGIEMLDFSGCHLNDRSLQQLLTSPYLGRLKGLNLNRNSINTPGVRALVQSTLFDRLQHLDLSRNIAIGDTAARLLAQAESTNNLEVLSLAETNLSLDGLYDLFQSASLCRLSHLNVSNVTRGQGQETLTKSSFMVLRVAAQLCSLDLSNLFLPNVNLPRLLAVLSAENLRFLHLRSCHIENRDMELLVQSSSLSKLTTLDLERNNLGAEGALVLADSPHFSTLTHLNISHNNIRDTGARAIAESSHLRHLQELNIAGNGIGGSGLKSLGNSANLVLLRSLNLAGNFIGVYGVRDLMQSAHLRNLTCLDLGDAFLEEDSARALASAANLARLRKLQLKKNLLGDGGAKALAHAPHLARLATLDLNDNRIGKAGAEALAAAAWRRMRNLDLRGNVFTDTQEALLRKRFGNAVQL
jgi:uncharacterized protein (TIGR02996 family)